MKTKTPPKARYAKTVLQIKEWLIGVLRDKKLGGARGV